MPDTSHSMPLVAIIDTDEDDLMRTMQMLVASDKARVVGTARRLDEIPHLMTAEPDIALLDVGPDVTHLPTTMRTILEHSPRCQIILIARQETQVDLVKAMQSGARGLLYKPVSMQELLDSLNEVFNTELLRLRRIEEQTKARVTQGRAGEVITVFSPKGGVGCTVVATHLAIALSGIEKAKVALVDFDLQFGDIAVHLDLRSQHGVHELMRNVNDLDGAILNDVMVQHNASGVRVLLPPATLDQVEDVDTEGLMSVVKALRKLYDYVVVDTFHSLEDTTISLMDLSSTLLVVTTPEVPALRSTRRFLDFIRERPDRRNKVQIVVNRYPSKSAVNISEIERSLGARPIGTIPSDGRLITASINEGISILEKHSAATTNIKQLALTIAQPRLARILRERQGERVTGAAGRSESAART